MYVEGNVSSASGLRWLVRDFVCRKQEANTESHTQLNGAAAPHSAPTQVSSASRVCYALTWAQLARPLSSRFPTFLLPPITTHELPPCAPTSTSKFQASPTAKRPVPCGAMRFRATGDVQTRAVVFIKRL